MSDSSEIGGSSPSRVPERPTTTYGFLAEAVAERDAAAFVHVGDRTDDSMQYLTRFGGPDRPYAFVSLPPDGDRSTARTVLCAPALFGEQAEREFPGDDVRTAGVGKPAGERAAAVLETASVEGTVLVPQDIPHDAAVYLESAGYDVTATDAVADARRTKTETEIDRHRRVQRAAALGMARAETVLAEATVEDGALYWGGSRLTTERLRREVNAVMSAAGVTDAGNSVIGSGATAADLHYVGDDDIDAGETVLLDLSPRGPEGYYADITRTFVVESGGGWERRAYVACEAARTAALEEVEAGASAGTVHEEAAAELAAHGFRIDSDEVGFTHSTGHGVGVSLHEAPSLSGETELQAGDVVTVEPGVYDPEEGGVRLEDTIVVREDGYELLQPYPFGSSPRVRDPEW